MLAAEEPSVADGAAAALLPFAPAAQAAAIAHGSLRIDQIPALFVHGTRDTFGTVDECKPRSR